MFGNVANLVHDRPELSSTSLSELAEQQELTTTHTSTPKAANPSTRFA
jgi:hypothetical protein